MSSVHQRIRKFWLVPGAALLLSICAGSVYACIDYLGSPVPGATVWISCGSSSGNYVFSCHGGSCSSACDPAVPGTCQVTQEQIDAHCNSPQSCQNSTIRPEEGPVN